MGWLYVLSLRDRVDRNERLPRRMIKRASRIAIAEALPKLNRSKALIKTK
jgi:hypothetical protein